MRARFRSRYRARDSMYGSRYKQILRQCCPPFLWSLLRAAIRTAPPPAGPRVVRTLEELDQELDCVELAARESEDAMRRALASFCFDPGVEMPADPHSAAYA